MSFPSDRATPSSRPLANTSVLLFRLNPLLASVRTTLSWSKISDFAGVISSSFDFAVPLGVSTFTLPEPSIFTIFVLPSASGAAIAVIESQRALKSSEDTLTFPLKSKKLFLSSVLIFISSACIDISWTFPSLASKSNVFGLILPSADGREIIDFSERFKIILSPDIFDLLDMSSISGFPLKTASFFDGKIERALADALRRSVDILTLPRARISPIFSSPDFNESTSSSSHSRLISAFFTTTLFFTLNLFAFPPWSRLA